MMATWGSVKELSKAQYYLAWELSKKAACEVCHMPCAQFKGDKLSIIMIEGNHNQLAEKTLCAVMPINFTQILRLTCSFACQT